MLFHPYMWSYFTLFITGSGAHLFSPFHFSSSPRVFQHNIAQLLERPAATGLDTRPRKIEAPGEMSDLKKHPQLQSVLPTSDVFLHRYSYYMKFPCSTPKIKSTQQNPGNWGHFMTSNQISCMFDPAKMGPIQWLLPPSNPKRDFFEEDLWAKLTHVFRFFFHRNHNNFLQCDFLQQKIMVMIGCTFLKGIVTTVKFCDYAECMRGLYKEKNVVIPVLWLKSMFNNSVDNAALCKNKTNLMSLSERTGKGVWNGKFWPIFKNMSSRKIEILPAWFYGPKFKKASTVLSCSDSTASPKNHWATPKTLTWHSMILVGPWRAPCNSVS